MFAETFAFLATTMWALVLLADNRRLQRQIRHHRCKVCHELHLYEMNPPPLIRGSYWPGMLTIGDHGETRPVFGPGEERWAEAYDNKMDALREEDADGST